MIDGEPRILIVRLGAIGDVVRVLPALHTLREVYPDARIDWAVEDKAADIITGHPGLDEALVFERSGHAGNPLKAFLSFGKRVRRNRYDVVLDFHGILKSGVLSAFSGARQRLGFARPRGRELSSLFANRRVVLPGPNLNRVEENFLLCEAFGCGRRNVEAFIYLPDGVHDEVAEFWDATFDGGKIVVALHVPMERSEKQWPAAHFAELADLLSGDGRFEVLLTWGPGQFDAVQEVIELVRRTAVIAPEAPSLKHYAALIQRANLYFGGDTGPMHIAWAMDTPVVAVFGGTDPAKHTPYLRPHEVLRAEDDGSARKDPAGGIDRVTPEVAYDACVEMVSGMASGGPPEGQSV